MSTLPDALHRFLAHETVAEAGSLLFHQGDEVRHLYVVRSGCVHLVRHSETGAVGVMQRATAGSVLAESSIFSAEYHCDAVVIAKARLARADMGQLRNALRHDFRAARAAYPSSRSGSSTSPNTCRAAEPENRRGAARRMACPKWREAPSPRSVACSGGRYQRFARGILSRIEAEEVSEPRGLAQPSLSRSLRNRISSASVLSIWSCIWVTSSFSRIPT